MGIKCHSKACLSDSIADSSRYFPRTLLHFGILFCLCSVKVCSETQKHNCSNQNAALLGNGRCLKMFRLSTSNRDMFFYPWIGQKILVFFSVLQNQIPAASRCIDCIPKHQCRQSMPALMCIICNYRNIFQKVVGIHYISSARIRRLFQFSSENPFVGGYSIE